MKLHLLRDERGELPQRVAILRALQLGDLLCVVPALRALRAALPETSFTLIGLPWAEVFVDRFDRYLDRFLEFPGYPGLPERTPEIGRIPGFLCEAQAMRFDLALQMHGSGSFVNPLTVLLGARRNAGFCVPGEFCPDPDRFVPYPDRGLELRRHLHLLEFLGIEPQGEELEFPLHDRDFETLQAIDETDGLQDGEYVCIHPGASVPERRWPASRFAAIADSLARQGLKVVLTGTFRERALTQEVAQSLAAPHVDLTGKTCLGALAALLSRARLLVSNDTGVAHLATALRVPSVVISTGSNPERWGPVDRELHRMLCRDSGVSTADVLAQAEDLLEARHLNI